MAGGKIVILGLGKQGKGALHDLVTNSKAAHIVVADNNPESLSYIKQYSSDRVTGQTFNANSETGTASVIRDADVVIEALPGHLSLAIGKLAAELGINLVSSMYYFDQGEQDEARIQANLDKINRIDHQAKTKGVTILNEFGLDPGIDLVLGAQAVKELDEVHEFYSYGAGLPAHDAANNPLKYKFSWSVIGVMRSYRRPAWIISGGKAVPIDAKEQFAPENMHVLNVKELGPHLECFPNGNSVRYAEMLGIRGSVNEMARYTCRWEGHCAFWNIMVKSGFLEEDPIELDGNPVSPVKFTASVLENQSQFQYSKREQDLTLIRIDARGVKGNEKKQVVYQLIDYRDLHTGFTSMQRGVGFTMGLGARLILDRKLTTPGLISPIDVPFDLVVKELEKHGIKINREETPGDTG
ncbi:MAG: saccharopine dehydrogenase NADP-binding domain-containing protein [Candidatus Zixiibacteriota bacterium]|nr:MAG: saccharopine dehydrogenase NADP-binding domain-containing protein [candidate division Zixibacteria bacterium]